MPAATYQLFIHVSDPCRIRAGRLPEARLVPGWYVYTGSAKRHLEARVRRHLRREKTRRWHIDWLLGRREARVVHVRLSTLGECELNAATGGQILIPGFGASDCRAGCASHLRYLGSERPDPVPAESLQRRSAALHALREALAHDAAAMAGTIKRGDS